MDALALLGQKTLALENEIIEHQKTVGILLALKAGAITLDRLTVTEKGWALLPAIAKPEPEEPPQAETATG